MSVDETLMCSFQILKPNEKKGLSVGSGRPNTPPKSKVIFFNCWYLLTLFFI